MTKIYITAGEAQPGDELLSGNVVLAVVDSVEQERDIRRRVRWRYTDDTCSAYMPTYSGHISVNRREKDAAAHQPDAGDAQHGQQQPPADPPD